MHVHLVDPSAFTPPYDHALARALARAGADVELITSRFSYGPVPAPDGYRLEQSFYKRTGHQRGRGLRRVAKSAEHVPDMLKYRRRARKADVVHWQWLDAPELDLALLPSGRPRFLTAHDIIPRQPRRWQVSAARGLMHRMDAVIVHSQDGAARLQQEVGLPPDRIRVIPHGPLSHLTHLPEEEPLPPGFAEATAPVVLFFGLWRPYKGLEVLLEACRELNGAEVWIVGMPREVKRETIEEAAKKCAATVRLAPRYIKEPEIPAFFRRADLVVLPYTDIDQSGVLYTALAFGNAIVASSIGGFTEVGEQHGAVRLVPPNDPVSLRHAITRLLESEDEREALKRAASRAATGAYSWDSIAERTLTLYREFS
jgi:glycosyltransferase involved in cell wall biosynthesis